MAQRKSKIIKKSKIDFNKDLDNVSAKIQSESEKEVKTPSPSQVKVEIQPNDKVMFNGKSASVVSVWPDGSIVILQDGMTIECTKKQVTVYDKIDTMEAPMKFKNGLPVSESCYTHCNVKINDRWCSGIVNEKFYVSFDEWNRKKGKQKVRIVCEDMEDTFDAPKSDVMLLELPDAGVGQTDGYVEGVIVDGEGGAERKVMVKALDYATSTNDSDEIPVLFFTDNGYKNGTCPKSMLKTLSV